MFLKFLKRLKKKGFLNSMIRVANLNELVKYKVDLEPFIREIQGLQKELYAANTFANTSGRGLLIQRYLENSGADITNISSSETGLKGLKEDLLNLETLTVKVSRSDFSPKFWEQLFNWLGENVTNCPFLLDREVEPSILGGLVVLWRGMYSDLSLKAKLSDFLEKESSYVLR